MKKTTLFLMSLFLTMGAMAQINADKVYTVVAKSHKNVTQPAWAVNNEKTEFVSTGNTTIDDDTQKYFAFIEFNNATYIYSVFAKKFVKNNATLVAGVPEAVTVQELDGGQYLFKFDNDHFINIGGVGQMTIDGWGDAAGEVDGGNTMTLTEVGEFSVDDLDEAVAMLDELYTPNNTGAKTNTVRKVVSFSVNDDTYTLTDSEQLQKYVDKTGEVFTVEVGSSVNLGMTQSDGWMNAFVYVDADKNGFSAGIRDNYVPTGDLVSYSFYNNGASSDEDGWNSAGTTISDDYRNTLSLPSFIAPSKAGTYRMRAKYDWCNINPAGDTGRYFNNDFAGHGAAIIDFTLVVKDVDKSALQNFIAEAETLLAKVADYSTEEGDGINISGKISSNAAQNKGDGNSGGTYQTDDGDGIAGLTDNNVNTYFHSRWSGTVIDEDHYLQIDLGAENTLSEFCFSYSVRKGENTEKTSPAPTAIEVRVGENGTDFGTPVATFTKGGNNLPSYTDLGAITWHSGVISADKNIRYIRLTVTGSEGPGNTVWEGHKFFAMSALNLYKTKQVPVVKDAYKDVITDEQMNMVAAALADAKTVNDNVASSAEVNTAASELDAALEPLRTATKRYTLSVSAAGWASLYLDFPAEIPNLGNDDAGVYIATSVKEGNWLILEKVADGVLPANTGVIVKAAQDDYDFIYSEGEPANVDGNLLEGTVTDELISSPAYVLSKPNGKEIGFYQAKLNKDATGNDGTTHFKNNNHKAYLPASKVSAGAALSAGFRFSFGGTTAVEEVEIENEREEIYDLTGRRLSEITKPGIYIINGKKVLVK